MKPKWYAAVRKQNGGSLDPRRFLDRQVEAPRIAVQHEWVCLLGPYTTKREADRQHNAAVTLFGNMFPVEELRGVVHATVKVRGDYLTPGLLNQKSYAELVSEAK